MIRKRGLYDAMCSNVTCAFGEKKERKQYQNIAEMGYKEFVRKLESMGWVVKGDMTFCSKCAKNPHGLPLMKI